VRKREKRGKNGEKERKTGKRIGTGTGTGTGTRTGAGAGAGQR
tara:strand:- start:546 stop:674 length:129 start_codon:yes stop_codon:yes gene_type:complete